MDGQAKVGTEQRLEDLPDKVLRQAKKAELLEVCRAAGLPAKEEMSRNALLTVARSGKRGGQNHHVHGKTLCPMRCGGVAYVYGVHDGKRYMRCNKCGYRFSRSIKG